MQSANEWEARGEARGEVRWKADLIFRQLRRQFADLPPGLRDRLVGLPPAGLDALAEALLDFTAPADLDSWLVANGSRGVTGRNGRP